MKENILWLKFVISGKPQDYLSYLNCCKQQKLFEDEVYAHYDRWPCHKRNEYTR